MEQFGPVVAQALRDDEVTEIMLNCNGDLFVESHSRGMEKLGTLTRAEGEGVIRTLASLLDKELDLKSPILSGEIPYNGSRFEGLLPPLVSAPVFSIRRHHSLQLPLSALVENGMVCMDEAEILRNAIINHRSIMISGATGCGKTTLINALLNEIGTLCPDERIITIEDTPELHLQLANYLHLYTSDYVDMSCLVRSALRLRPDRIVVGEVRGAEALDLIDALSTGHPGGLASVHAGSIEQALKRLSLLISRHKSAPKLIEPTLASAVDLVVQLARKPFRHISTIAKITGFSGYEFTYETLIKRITTFA